MIYLIECYDKKVITYALRGGFEGTIPVTTDITGKKVIGEADVLIQADNWHCEPIPLRAVRGRRALYFTFKGTGTLDMKSFAFLAK